MVYSVGLLVFFMWSDFEKPLSHFEQLKVFSSVWVLSCSFKELDLEIHLSRFVYLNGFSPVSLSNLMVRSSCHTLGTWMESLPCESSNVPSSRQLLRNSLHSVQLKGFSSVWILSCSFKELDLEKYLSHFVHLNGISPEWYPYVPSSGQLLWNSCHTLSN